MVDDGWILSGFMVKLMSDFGRKTLSELIKLQHSSVLESGYSGEGMNI